MLKSKRFTTRSSVSNSSIRQANFELKCRVLYIEHVEDDSIPSRLRLDTCAAAISLVCAILSFLLYLVPTITVEIPAVQSQTPLPRPNQYIGLDSINRTALNATSPSPIVTYSALLAQFSLAEPAYVYPVMGHDYFERDFGTISPDDKYFAVDQRVSRSFICTFVSMVLTISPDELNCTISSSRLGHGTLPPRFTHSAARQLGGIKQSIGDTQ